MNYTVKSLAKLAGITVRTLHHYDKIGLLSPDHINESGYRIYTVKELEILQQILFFKELDFSLDDIKRILDSPEYNRLEALQMHRTLLEKEKRRLARLLKTIDRCIDEAQGGDMVIMKDKFDGLSKAELEAYKEEAKAKWGVEIVEASEKRLRDKGLDNPEVLQEQLEDIFTRTAAVMDRKVEDKAVQKLMEELRSYMNQFYDCSDEMFRGLGQMYVEDERFHKNISKFGTGLPEFLAKAMAYSTENS